MRTKRKLKLLEVESLSSKKYKLTTNIKRAVQRVLLTDWELRKSDIKMVDIQVRMPQIARC